MRLIDADALKRQIRQGIDPHNFSAVMAAGAFFGEVDKSPTVDAVHVVHGKWECLATEHNAYRWQVDAVCSCCGFVKQGVWGGFFPDAPSEIAESVALRYAGKVKLPRYCETCGAKMDGERREADEAD